MRGGRDLIHFVQTGAGPVEFLDAAQLAKRLNVPLSWIRNYTRRTCRDPLPHIKVGRYVRFPWPSTELDQWFRRHAVTASARRK